MATLHVIEGKTKKGRTIHIRGNTVFLGRSSRNDIQIEDPTVSRKHLKAYRIGNHLFVEDLKSTNGTSINGKPIKAGEGYKVGEGETIAIGKTLIRPLGISKRKELEIENTDSRHESGFPKNEVSQKENRGASPNVVQEFLDKPNEGLVKPTKINETLEGILTHLLDSFPRINKAAILLVDGQRNEIREVIARSKQSSHKVSLRFRDALVRQALRHGKAIKVSNTLYVANSENVAEQNHLQMRCAFCVPMINNSKLKGGVYIESLEGPHDAFRRGDYEVLNKFSGLLASAIENASFLLH